MDGHHSSRAHSGWLLALLFVAIAAHGQETPTVSLHHSSAEDSTLTLPEALALALQHSPALAAFSWDLRAADAMIAQAGLKPNPELSVEIEGIRWTPGPTERTNASGLSGAPAALPTVTWDREVVQGAHSGFAESEITVSIVQLIELGRKRAKRIDLAEREKDLLVWDYQAARADVLAQTATQFFAVLAAQERAALEKELVELTGEVVRVFALRVQAGQVSPIEQTQAEIALATTQSTYRETLKQLDAARALLAANWGATSPTSQKAAGQLDDIAPVPPLEEFTERLRANPDLARWATEVVARRAASALERSQRVPDLTLELGFRRTNLAQRTSTQIGMDSSGTLGVTRSKTGYDAGADESLVLGFSLPLPIFDRNQGRIAYADAMTSKAAEEQRRAESAAYAEVAAAHLETAGAYETALSLRNEVLPKVSDTFAKIQRGYQEGKFNYLEVLDTQRTLFDAREAFIDALTRYHEGVVRLERLAGQSLEADNDAE